MTTSDSDLPRDEALGAARDLVLEVLRKELRVEEEPQLLADDLLLFAVRSLGRGDPGWLLARLLDPSFDLEARILVWSQLAGPPRAAAVSGLRQQAPEHEIWDVRLLHSIDAPPDPSDLDPRLPERLARLAGGSNRERELAAEELRDIGTETELAPSSYRAAAEALLRAMLVERDPAALEAILNSTAELASVPDQERVDAVDWSPLAALLERIDEASSLLYALDAIEATGHATHRAAVERLRAHPASAVREAAESALASLHRQSESPRDD